MVYQNYKEFSVPRRRKATNQGAKVDRRGQVSGSVLRVGKCGQNCGRGQVCVVRLVFGGHCPGEGMGGGECKVHVSVFLLSPEKETRPKKAK